MLIFVNSNGQALVTATRISTRNAFSFPELDQQFSAIVTNMKVMPRPVVSVVSTLGGHNYLNVFGEDPLSIELQGVLVGTHCSSGGLVATAISNAVEFYRSNGVINRVTPISFTLQGDKSRKAFLVAMSIMQDNNFIDIANFSLLLIAESLDERELASATAPSLSPTNPESDASRGITSNVAESGGGAAPAVVWNQSLVIDRFGEVVTPETQSVVLT